MKRRLLLGALVASSFCSRLSRAAPSTTTRRLGVLWGGDPDPADIAELHQALESFGWIEGKNIVLIMRYDQHDAARREELAAELVRASPHVLATVGHSRTRALQRVTSTIPIFTLVDDPISEGFSTSLVTPSGNITGLALGADKVDAKQIQLLLQVVPRLRRLGYFHTARYAATADSIPGLGTAARAAGIAVELFPVHDMNDLSQGFQALRGSAKSAAYIAAFGGVLDWKELAACALEFGMPTFCVEAQLVDAGGLLCYRLRFADRNRQGAGVLDKLLRGMNPSRIPFELPTRSFLSINRATARALGIEVPAEILVRADRVVQ